MANTRCQARYCRRAVPALLFAIVAIAGCGPESHGYIPVAEIARNGFLRDPAASAAAQGREIKLSGYVDHGNLYGDTTARRILGEWWSGESREVGSWRFNLKAAPDDAVGHSFAVFVVNDPGRQDLLQRFAADAEAQRSTRVFVRGRLFRYEAPMQARKLTGLYLEVASSDDIRLQPPGEGIQMDRDNR